MVGGCDGDGGRVQWWEGVMVMVEGCDGRRCDGRKV